MKIGVAHTSQQGGKVWGSAWGQSSISRNGYSGTTIFTLNGVYFQWWGGLPVNQVEVSYAGNGYQIMGF